MLPAAGAQKRRLLFLSGACYESAVIHEFLRAAGFELDERQVSPVEPLPAGSVDLTRYDAVVLGPVFHPLSSLGTAFLKSLKSAVEGGLGCAVFPLNTSAYTSGRYDVEDLRGSALEALLPATFTADTYRNSEDAPSSGPLAKAADHPVWRGVDLSNPPDPGLGVGVLPRDERFVLARAGKEPVLTSHALGKGRVILLTASYGGHNFQAVGFRSWLPCHKLLTNIVEYAATGDVASAAFDPHSFRPLEQVPATRLESLVKALSESATQSIWEVKVQNSGKTLAMFVEIANASEAEGVSFDWFPAENFFILLPGEKRTVLVSATARPGQALPLALIPSVSAWNG